MIAENAGAGVSEEPKRGRGWRGIAVVLRAILIGLLIGLIAANIWVPLLFALGLPNAAVAEALFLAGYVWWVRGGGPPRSWKTIRAELFRARDLSGAQWAWGSIAAISFAATIHAAMVVLFRLVPFPAAAFHAGYDLSAISSVPMRWLAVVTSAVSAGICEETGFRGYMQVPIEKRHGAFIAILISSLLFMLVHLNKNWALIGMVPIVFGAGVLLGLLAWASRTLVFGMIGHTIMDIGLFAYWWTQIAGTFSQRPISETGMDRLFLVECGILAAAFLIALLAIVRLRRLT